MSTDDVESEPGSAPAPLMPGPPVAIDPPVHLTFGQNLRRQLRFAAMGVWTAYCTLTGLFLRRVLGDPEGTRSDAWKQLWGRGACWILGIDRTVVQGAPPRTPGRGRLVVANHRTPLDIACLMSEFGGIFLANHKTKSAPIIGMAAEAVITIFVDRDDKNSGAQAIRQMRRYLSEGRTVVVFPEGTTFPGDEVRELKGGALIAAAGLPVDIVPVGLAYPPGTEFTENKLSTHSKRFLSRKETPMKMAVGTPVPAPKSRKGLEEKLQKDIQDLVDRSRSHR